VTPMTRERVCERGRCTEGRVRNSARYIKRPGIVLHGRGVSVTGDGIEIGVLSVRRIISMGDNITLLETSGIRMYDIVRLSRTGREMRGW